MRLKSALLLAAAALASASGAHAADLAVAEPVDYVKVCDAFGAGFFYSPGTDSCIKIGGYVKFGTGFGNTHFGYYNITYPDSEWSNFFTETSIQLTASSATEYGNLTGFLDFRAQTGNTGSFSQSVTQFVNSDTSTGYVDSAWLSMGPVKAGYFTSLFDFGRGYTDTGGFGSDTTSDHIQFTYASGGWAFAGSIEDQRDRGAAGSFGDSIVEKNGLLVSGGQNNIPDLVAAVTYASGIFSTKFAAAYVNDAVSSTYAGTVLDATGRDGSYCNPAFGCRTSELDPIVGTPATGWAVGGNMELALDMVAKGDKFFVTAAYGDNANSYTGIAGGTSVADLGGFIYDDAAALSTGTSVSAMASYKHVWTPQLWSAVTASYAEFDGTGVFSGYGLNAWRGVFSTSWAPVNGLEFMVDADYAEVAATDDTGSAWAVNLWLKRSWE